MCPKPSAFFEPAAAVPVSSEVGSLVGYNDDVTGSGWDRRGAPGTHVVLACLVGLNGLNELVALVTEEVGNRIDGVGAAGHGRNATTASREVS